MDWTLEVVVLPVSDIDRSIAFYRDQVGLQLDHDTQNEHMHVTQLTPPGSGCSIVFGDLPPMTEMEPGSMKSLQLVVSDAAAARQELAGRAVQEIKAREQTPLIPKDHAGLGEWAGR
jgi:catechol 2,3-dioxygenase-like lactoylglutathione lyase family enzyme